MFEFKKMKPAVKKLWLKALRSGKYLQTRGGLRGNAVQDYKGNPVDAETGVGYCCLGVLQDLYAQEHNVDFGKGKKYLRVTGKASWGLYPSRAVCRWAGLDYHSKDVSEEQGILGEWNDGKTTFLRIADWIEENL